MIDLGPVKANEMITRVLVHSNQVKRLAAVVDPKAFLLSDGTDEISVDRRSHMSAEEAFRFALRTALRRGKIDFHGWAELSVESAMEDGRKVFASPIPGDNRYHATIKLPPGAASDRHVRKYHALRLASRARWVERPPGPAFGKA